MKNKFKSLLATALLVIGLGGCGSKTSSSSEPVNQSSTNSQPGVIGENNYYNEENISLTKQYQKDCKQIHILRS